MNTTKKAEFLQRTNVVGVIAGEADMRTALADPSVADIFEWRVDIAQSEEVELGMSELDRPKIVTVRDKSEGGKEPAWTVDNRKGLYRRLMYLATFIDIEASTAYDLKKVIVEAQEREVGVIISCHDFKSIPSSGLLRHAYGICKEVKGDIFKIAAQADSLQDIVLLINLVARLRGTEGPNIAAMAMGKFGPASRLLFGAYGSPLVYGHLGKAQVPGQLRAADIKFLLRIEQ